VNGKALVLLPPEGQLAREDLALRDLLKKQNDPVGTTRLVCHGSGGTKPLWQAAVPGAVRLWRVAGDRVVVVTFGGELMALAPDDGRVLHRFAAGRVLANFDACPLPGGRYARANEPQLAAFDAEGRELWQDEARVARGLNPPAFGALTALGDVLYVGGSDGGVDCREQKSGRRLWRAEVGPAIASLHVDAGEPGRVLAVGWDGTVHGLRDGKVIWKADVARGAELARPPAAVLTPAGLVVGCAGSGRIALVSPDRGDVRDLTPHAAWCVGGDRLITWSGGRLAARPLRP
jgi:outer membrane protein assembly factor BamB